jgi:SgrR family transcriptional regulator
MQTVDHYIRLFSELIATAGQRMEISLERVAEVLCCTPRNGKLILKKMQDLHRIAWVPGRGRGNRSVLTLLVEPADLLFGIAKELVQKGDVREATSLVAKYGERVPDAGERFQVWLKSHFGYHAEGQGTRRVDTLRLSLSKPLRVLDPAHVAMRSECHMVKQVFDCLVRYDVQRNVVEPHLAYFWEVDEVGTAWTFYLRKGVMFHHGRSLTAQDVVYTLKRLQNAEVNSPFRWMVANVAKAEALNEHTVQIRLMEADHLFLQILSHEHLSILPQDYGVEVGDEVARLPVGTGPFKLVRNDESMLVLTAFESYFRERALLDRLEFWIVPEWGEHEERFASSRYEVQDVSRETSLSNGNDAAAAWTVTAKTEWNVQLLTFHIGKPGPQAHRAFREAMHVIVDRQQMIDDLGGMRQEPALRLLPPSGDEATGVKVTGSREGLESTASKYDASKYDESKYDESKYDASKYDASKYDESQCDASQCDASVPETTTLDSSTMFDDIQASTIRALLTDAGYNGETLHLYSFDDPDHVEDGEWIRQRCAAFGVMIELHFCTVQDLLQKELIQQADFILDGTTVSEDIELSLLDLFLTENSFIKNHLDHERNDYVQSHITHLRQRSSLQTRLGIWCDIEQHLLETSAFLGLYRNEARLRAHPELQGIELNVQGWIDYRQLWFKKRDILHG